MVPVPTPPGAVGAGRCCGHRTVCTWNFVSGCFRPAVRMLLQPSAREPYEEEEAEEDREHGDLDK